MTGVAAGLVRWLSFLFAFSLANHALAQPTKTYRIGFLTPASAASIEDRLSRFRQGLQELGYVQGQNAAIEFRSAEGKQERLGELATELIRLKVDILLTHGALATLAAKKASTTIPIVCLPAVSWCLPVWCLVSRDLEATSQVRRSSLRR